jgi:arylsulfatase A-like enzyme
MMLAMLQLTLMLMVLWVAIIIILATPRNIFFSEFTATTYKNATSVTLNVKAATPLPLSGQSCMSTNSCPNIVYLLADDLGYGDVEYNGGQAVTPHLNAMANGPHSIHFSRFYSGGPTCSPTRGTLLTGRNHNRYCIWHADIGSRAKEDLTCPSLMPLPHSELTVAEILKEIGYHTAIYGKWHVGDLIPIDGGNEKWNKSNPCTNGFTDWLVTERISTSVLPNCKCSSSFSCTLNGTGYDIIPRCFNYWYMHRSNRTIAKYNGQVFEDSHFLVDHFEDFLRKRSTTQPFFAQISFHSVHSQYLATPEWLEYYKNVTSINKKRYLGATSALDEAIGRVRSVLQNYNNTIVWFSSDNGPERGQGSTGGLRGRKGSLWEGGIRVPGIIEWPAVIKGNRKSSTPVVTSDFLPTVADIVGYELPHSLLIDGISILPLLQNRTDRRGTNINFAFHIKKGELNSSFSGAVVGDQYKYYAEFRNSSVEKFYLFDLESDDKEKNNVSSSNIALTESMKAELEQFLLSVNESATQVGCIHTHDRRHTDKC